MSIFTRYGDRVELVRPATLADVKTFERRKADKEDRDRTKNGWRAIARYCGGPNRHPSTVSGLIANGCGDENVGKEILVDAAYLKADEGWSEISAAFVALHKASAGETA